MQKVIITKYLVAFLIYSVKSMLKALFINIIHVAYRKSFVCLFIHFYNWVSGFKKIEKNTELLGTTLIQPSQW